MTNNIQAGRIDSLEYKYSEMMEEKCKLPFPKQGDNKYFDSHYTGRVQPIEVMQSEMSKEQFEGFILGNIVKYALRFGKKDEKGKESAKILRYAQWLNELVNGKVIDPRSDS